MQPFLRKIEKLEEHFDAVDWCSCPSSEGVAAKAILWAAFMPDEPVPEHLPIICTHRRHRPRPASSQGESETLFPKLLGDDYTPLEPHVAVSWEDNIKAIEAREQQAVDIVPDDHEHGLTQEQTERVQQLEDKIGKTWDEHKELHGIKDDRLPTGENDDD